MGESIIIFRRSFFSSRQATNGGAKNEKRTRTTVYKEPLQYPEASLLRTEALLPAIPGLEKGTGFTGRLEHRTAWYSGHHQGQAAGKPDRGQAIARLYYSGQIAIVDRCIEKLDPTLAPFILKGVTEGIGFEKLQAQGCPCCREMYYEYYRYFFWLLSKERQ